MSILMRKDESAQSQAGFVALRELNKPWVDGYYLFKSRTIPRVKTGISASDRRGSLKARWGIGRMNYRVLPGLYAAGKPDSTSPVFVTANYKMSFDALRSNLDGLDAWLLVLDTRGINVWCAAGKGTFGTGELVRRIQTLKLDQLVSHKRLVLPQLGAPGVSAPEVARISGFRVEWGPVRAGDIKTWLANGRQKDEAMRTVSFAFRDRMAVAPVEVVHAWPLLPASALLSILYGLPFDAAWASRALPAFVLLVGTIPIGTLLFPALLPWLPSRAFVVKGGALGILWASGCALTFRMSPPAALSGILVSAPVTGFFAMNFTGVSTYTCQPGALLEVEKSFWPMVISVVAGVGLAVVSRLLGI